MALNLEIALPSDREILITRSFDAPRERVWDAHTTPALGRRWLLGPPGWELPVREIDLRVGGKYRYDWVDKGRDEESRPEEGGASNSRRAPSATSNGASMIELSHAV